MVLSSNQLSDIREHCAFCSVCNVRFASSAARAQKNPLICVFIEQSTEQMAATGTLFLFHLCII